MRFLFLRLTSLIHLSPVESVFIANAGITPFKVQYFLLCEYLVCCSNVHCAFELSSHKTVSPLLTVPFSIEEVKNIYSTLNVLLEAL